MCGAKEGVGLCEKQQQPPARHHPREQHSDGRLEDRFAIRNEAIRGEKEQKASASLHTHAGHIKRRHTASHSLVLFNWQFGRGSDHNKEDTHKNLFVWSCHVFTDYSPSEGLVLFPPLSLASNRMRLVKLFVIALVALAAFLSGEYGL